MIDKYAFYNTKITAITLPESVEEIQEGIFENCKDLATIEFGEESELKILGKMLLEIVIH